jgi:hypothetical protein
MGERKDGTEKREEKVKEKEKNTVIVCMRKSPKALLQ